MSLVLHGQIFTSLIIANANAKVINRCDCQEEYNPVCGVDGNTYNSECEANCVDSKIQCYKPCPCDTENPSPQTEPKPCNCPEDENLKTYDVCGADRVTYSSKCAAECKNVPIECDKACPCNTLMIDPNKFEDETDQLLWVPKVTPTTTKKPTSKVIKPSVSTTKVSAWKPPTSNPDSPWQPKTKTIMVQTNITSKILNVSNDEPKSKQAPVKPKPEPKNPCSCTKEAVPVCGSDRVTYPNACHAKCQGYTVACQQKCPCPPKQMQMKLKDLWAMLGEMSLVMPENNLTGGVQERFWQQQQKIIKQEEEILKQQKMLLVLQLRLFKNQNQATSNVNSAPVNKTNKSPTKTAASWQAKSTATTKSPSWQPKQIQTGNKENGENGGNEQNKVENKDIEGENSKETNKEESQNNKTITAGNSTVQSELEKNKGESGNEQKEENNKNEGAKEEGQNEENTVDGNITTNNDGKENAAASQEVNKSEKREEENEKAENKEGTQIEENKDKEKAPEEEQDTKGDVKEDKDNEQKEEANAKESSKEGSQNENKANESLTPNNNGQEQKNEDNGKEEEEENKAKGENKDVVQNDSKSDKGDNKKNEEQKEQDNGNKQENEEDKK